jgi:hypothetical protein
MGVRRARLIVVVVLLAVAASFAGITRAGGGEGEPDRITVGGWPGDSNGDGVISDQGAERIPDLIRAVGDDGTEGYVWRGDLDGPQPSNPGEAVQMSGQTRVIPLYAEDGHTVSGTYTMSGD